AAPGETVWSPRDADSVFITADAKQCQVTTRGPLTLAAMDAVDKALSDPHGFVAETPGEPTGRPILKRYSKKVGAQTFPVTLAGSGAGGDAPASELVATVTATPLA